VKHVLSIDPGGVGGHTGVAYGKYGPRTPYTLVDYAHVPEGVVGFREYFPHTDSVGLTATHMILVEDFEDFGVRGADRSPLKIIGACEYLWGGSEEFHLVRPIDRKFVSDDVMKALGAYVPGGHHRDVTEAARHAVAWLVKNNHQPTIKIGWPHAERF
jgi:hypothetical protein